MKDPKVNLCWNLVFNNTGLKWSDLQNEICNIVEKDYVALHCISDKFYEELDVGCKYKRINDIECLLYFRVKDLSLEVIAIRTNYDELLYKFKNDVVDDGYFNGEYS